MALDSFGYIVQGPVGSIFAKVRLRIHAIRPVADLAILSPEEYRITIQTFTAAGKLIADSAVCQGLMTRDELREYLRNSKADGWRIFKCEATEKLEAAAKRNHEKTEAHNRARSARRNR